MRPLASSSTCLASPPYVPVDPKGVPTGRTTYAPFVFYARGEFWSTMFGPEIDEMTSDPLTLNVLGALIQFLEPKVIVEVGTYRGWGTAVFAETLRLYNLPGHIWSCDPVDHGVQQMLDKAELSPWVTLVNGTFEDLIAMLNSLSHGLTTPMDFCYIDGAERLPYTTLALQHMNPGGLVAVDDCAGEWKGAKTLRRMADLYLPEHRGLALLRKHS